MMMKMMLKKMFNEDSSSPFGNMDSSSSDKFDMLKMLTQHMRSKRATDDIFELGDRLTEKLKSEQQRCKLNLAMPHAFSKSSISSTKTSKSMSTPWLNQSKRENGRIPRRMAQGTSHQGLPHMRHFCQLHSRLGLRRLPIRRKMGKNRHVLPMRTRAKIQDLHEPRHEAKIRKVFRKD